MRGEFGGLEVCLDLRGLEQIEESSDGKLGEVGGVDEIPFDAEHGDDDVDLVGREWREMLEFVLHEVKVVARPRRASGFGRMTERLRTRVGDRGGKSELTRAKGATIRR